MKKSRKVGEDWRREKIAEERRVFRKGRNARKRK